MFNGSINGVYYQFVRNGLRVAGGVYCQACVLVASAPLPLPGFEFKGVRFSVAVVGVFLPPRGHVVGPVVVYDFLVDAVEVVRRFRRAVQVGVIGQVVSAVSVEIL